MLREIILKQGWFLLKDIHLHSNKIGCVWEVIFNMSIFLHGDRFFILIIACQFMNLATIKILQEVAMKWASEKVLGS